MAGFLEQRIPRLRLGMIDLLRSQTPGGLLQINHFTRLKYSPERVSTLMISS